jgi:hypothetical protein
MTLTEKSRLFFEQLPERATAQDYRNAAAATGDVSDIADVIAGHAQAHGVDASGVLQELQTAREQAGQRTAEEEAAAVLAEKSGALAGESNPEKRRELIDDIRRAAVSIGTAGKTNPLVTYEAYRERRAARKYWETFCPDLFNGLPFTDGDIHLIGARSGAGKTNALINIMRELLLTAAPEHITSNENRARDKNAKRRIVFISREMSIDDILDRLTLSIAWGTGTYREILKDSRESFFDLQRFHTANDYPDVRPAETYQAYNDALDNYIYPAMKTGWLVLYDALDAESLEEILGRLTALSIGQGDVVLVDYIQLLPAASSADAERYGSSADHLRMRYIVHALRTDAKRSGAILYARHSLTAHLQTARQRGTR